MANQVITTARALDIQEGKPMITTLQPREELINLEYLALAQRNDISPNKFALLVEEQWIENYVDSLSDEQVELNLLNINL